MEWPYRRFLKAFSAFQRRVLCDEWRARKRDHIAALWSNSNWDSEENDRNAAIEKIEESYDQIIRRLWDPNAVIEEEQEEDKAWNSGLMRAGRKALGALGPPRLPGQTALEALPA